MAKSQHVSFDNISSITTPKVALRVTASIALTGLAVAIAWFGLQINDLVWRNVR
jgi:hypothetical protein